MLIIGISGGSGSGKTSFALMMHAILGAERCSLLQQDWYYHDHSHLFDQDGGSANFDHPDAIDFDLLTEHLLDLKKGRSISAPIYDYATHRRVPETRNVPARPIVLVEGMLILSRESVREHLDLSVFVDSPEELRLSRRMARDTRDRGRDEAGVRRQFEQHVKPMHDLFVESSKGHADRVYSGEEELETNVRDLLLHIGLEH